MGDKEKALLGPLWVLRARMAFFVSNLAFYLQVGWSTGWPAPRVEAWVQLFVLFLEGCWRGRAAYFAVRRCVVDCCVSVKGE